MPEDDDLDVRGALERAFDAEESKDDNTGAEESSVSAIGEETSSGDESGASEVLDAGRSGEEDAGDAASEPADGSSTPKFLPPEEDQVLETQESEVAGAPVEPQERPPVAWRGEAKEAWAKVPQEVREEVLRREQEVNEVLRESSGSRRFQEAFERTVAPFREMIAAEGGDPLRSTQNLMQTAAVLRVGTPQQKAQTVAQVVRQFGVDINALDEALVGQGANGGGAGANGGLTPDVQQYFQQQMDPVNRFMANVNQAIQTRDAEQEQSVLAEIEAFEQNPKYVYYEDVREDMSDLMRLAGERGQRMSLEQAYDRAVSMNSRISQLVARKKEVEKAQKDQGDLAAKRRAAASIQGRAPAPVVPKEPEDLRGAISRAWDLEEQKRA